MAISASTITPTNSLEDFRIEFNNLISDVTAVEVTNTFATSIIFEGATENIHETTLIVTDPTADRTITLPNVTGTITLDGNPLTSDGGTLGTAALEWSDIYLADGGVVYLGADQDVSLTHVADTGVLLNSTRKIQFNDASQFIHGSSATVLSIGATDEIDLTATAVDLNGTLDVSGTLTQTGIATFAARPVFNASVTIQDGGSIGSTSDLNAVTISSGGVVAVTATTASTNSTSGALTVAGGAGIAADLGVGDDLRMISDAAVISFGADSDVTLTHVADTGLLLNSTMKLQFNDASQFIHGSSATVLDIGATDEIELTATLVDVVGNFTVSGTGAITGAITGAAITASGILKTDDTTAATSTTDGSLQTDGGLSVAADAVIGDDLFMLSDAAVVTFGADKDVTLTHVADTGLLLNGAMQLQFSDASQFINAPSATVLDINATDEIELNATLVDVNANLDVSGTLTQTGIATFAARPVFNASVTIQDDGSIGSASDPNAVTISSGGVVAVTATTASSSSTTGALTVAGGAGVAADLSVGDDLRLISDATVLSFGADSDVTVTHVADTGLLLNSTMKLQFNDASQFIHGSSATVLSIGATDEIDLTATLIDLNGNLDVSGSLTVAGTTTLNGNLVLGDAAADTLTIGATLQGASPLTFEGGTADGYETTFAITDPTADRTITFPNLTGTISLITATETLTNKTLTAPTINGVVGGTQTSATITTLTTTTVNASGVITGSTVEATGDTASGDNAAIGYTSAEGLILTGQGSTNDVTIKNDADADVIKIPTGTTNVTIVGDLTVTGDDLYMATNTSGYVMVADGTNFNPVAVSGDVTMSSAGAITIASTSVEGSMLNDNVISGLTALTSGLATTDEFMISSGSSGTLKRMDVSVLTVLTAADATALAIALG
jgi:hypothetical protein